MTQALLALPMEHLVIVFCLAMTRVSAFIVSGPIAAAGALPLPVKVGLCTSLSMFLMPAYLQHDALSHASHAGILTAYMFFEFIIGVSLGYLFRLTLLPCKIAGLYIGQEMGFNLGQVSDPTSGNPTNEAAMLFDAICLVLFWVTDVDHVMWKMLYASAYTVPTESGTIYGMSALAAELICQAFRMGLMLISPLAAVLFLTLIGMSMIMRAWSQVTLFSFGMGARLLVGFIGFLWLFPLIITSLTNLLQNMAQIIIDSVLSI